MDDLLEGQTDLLKNPSPEQKSEVEIDGLPDGLVPDSEFLRNDATVPQASGEIPLEDETVEPEPQADFSGGFEKLADETNDDPTVRLKGNDKTEVVQSRASAASVNAAVDDEVRASVGRYGAFRNTSSPTGAALAQSENLRIAQSRILELENELQRVRTENESLASAGETFRRKSDELGSRMEDLENRYQHAVSSHAEEKALLLQNKESLRNELNQMKTKTEELESRITTNIQKIRVRERELENRLELVKMEGTAIIRSKDEMVLDLKRQIDQLNLELSNYRVKNQELNRAIADKQDILRRTVKALRLALTMLEGDEESIQPQRKAK